jgi:hypothetical protein
VAKKEAIRNAEKLPPWPPIILKMYGRKYYFPFRLTLDPVRKMEEPLVRPEFFYVAENLLLRGGYRKTHFQADQTTLQNSSQMGTLWITEVQRLELRDYSIFTPKIVGDHKLTTPPEVFGFQELLLQALIRQHLREENNMLAFLKMIDIDGLDPNNLEVLGEKALSVGNVDILIKEAVPIGISRKIVIEVKRRRASVKDVEQLKAYVSEMGDEVVAGVLLAETIGKSALVQLRRDENHKLKAIIYRMKDYSTNQIYTFNELMAKLELQNAESINPSLRRFI